MSKYLHLGTRNFKLFAVVGTEVLTVVVVKSTIFWVITPYTPLKVNRRFGGTYHLHLQGQSTSREICQSESRWKAEQNDVPPKRRLALNGLYGVISQKMVFLKLFAVPLTAIYPN
jgi:hypothetical protein